jgi:AcrR family transcriptional regulator
MNTANNKPNSRKIQAEERRLQIMETALSIFAEKGFTEASIKDLADAAGISSGLMYHYFPSKELLLEATVEQFSFLPQLRIALRDTKGQSSREVLTNIALEFLKLLEKREKLIKILLQEGSSNTMVQKVWFNMAREGVTLLEKYVAARVATGEFKPHNTEVTARGLFSILLMLYFTKDIFKSSKMTNRQFIDNTLDNLLLGIQNTGR